MPLNPNGKIDKPALPYPDTAQIVPAGRINKNKVDLSDTLSTTEASIQSIWLSLLPNSQGFIGLDDNFFDLGGHSILATRLTFEIRKTFAVNAPLGLIFERPTVRELAQEVEQLRNADLGLVWNAEQKDRSVKYPTNGTSQEISYGNDLDALLSRLHSHYAPLPSHFGQQSLTVFLTGATGFLGTFILRDLLSRQPQIKKVICLVRANDANDALSRIRDNAVYRGIWRDEWIREKRLWVVTGDLGLENFGLDETIWQDIAKEVDIVLHNGAWVSCILFSNAPEF
jgi:L-2-aminoadipate reductase